MTTDAEPRAWLLLAAGERRDYGGNAGYEDQVDAYYSWDSTVANAARVRPGDVIALRNKESLLGISVVEDIDSARQVKERFRCPRCGSSKIKPRSTTRWIYRCQTDGHEFDLPDVLSEVVTTYRSRHDAAWSPLPGVMTSAELRNLTASPNSPQSMRPIDWTRLAAALAARGAERSVSRVIGRAPDLRYPSSDQPHVAIAGGHRLAIVRVRRGQSEFRRALLATYRGGCAFTGPAPDRALEAGHLYSYAKLGEHHAHGGLLLRRDVHRLFDDGEIAVDPETLRLDLSPDLTCYRQYEWLSGRRLRCQVDESQVDWLAKHWAEHRADA